MNGKSIYKLRTFISIMGALVFAALIVWLIAGVDSAKSASDEQRLENEKQSVMNGAVLCYSVEGFYPDSLEYLKENYGLSYDEGRYLVHYRYVSADITPLVSVYDERYREA